MARRDDPPLFAGGVARRSLEQADPALAAKLLVVVKGDRSHALLVRLAWTVDIEVAKADDLRSKRTGLDEAAPDDLVAEYSLPEDAGASD